MARVAIIGAGITGLAAAFRLDEIAAEHAIPIDVTIFERGARAGGPLETIHDGAFNIETGADSFLSEKPWAAALARRLGLEFELIPTREEFRRTMIVHGGRLVEIPPGFSLLAPARLLPVLRSDLFSLRGKLRIALEPFIPVRRDIADESLASFVTRRLGREVLDNVAQALAGGIYTADPERLSLTATMPRFIEMERRYGSVVRGLRAADRARSAASKNVSGARWNLFLSLRNGIGTMAEALVSRLGPRIRTGTEVTSVRRVGARWCLDFGNATDEFDAVICAAPAHAASTMLAGDAPALGKLLGEIPYASAAVANFVWRETDFPEHPRSFGFVVPIRERRKIIAGSFSSLKYENRAPAGFITARAFLGGVLQTAMLELSDAELIAASREEFRDLLRVSADPIRASVRRWPQSMPQYEVGHIARVAQIETAAAKIPAFELAGSAYRGVGIPDCIHDAETAAEKIAAALAPEVSVK